MNASWLREEDGASIMRRGSGAAAALQNQPPRWRRSWGSSAHSVLQSAADTVPSVSLCAGLDPPPFRRSPSAAPPPLEANQLESIGGILWGD